MTPLSTLRTYWGFLSFREGQEEIINAVMSGKDTLALLPTGGGKSICYQVPALMKDGLCLVITPLIALMKDQVESLIEKGIDAAMLNNSMNYAAIQQTLSDASAGYFKFLYVSPERLRSNLFRDYIESLNINLIAVDEAHCISQWGYDFRPSYISIAEIRDFLCNVPILAVTASATKFVRDDIILKLKLKSPAVFQQSFVRSNLSYSVFYQTDKIIKVFEILKNVEGSSIIYCRSRSETKNVAQLLQLKGITAGYYHAGLTFEERSTIQKEWMNNQLRVIVATNAFGMGIDKTDVRSVIHLYVPDCLESYYQEAGRAGRDNKKAYAVLVYNDNDLYYLTKLSDKKFPTITTIKQVYQSLVNYLQIAVGCGAGQSFDFNIEHFVTHFKIETNLAINVIKILEQEGHLVLSEGTLTPSCIQFISDKETINSIEESYPELGEVIKALMRSYSGIFDNSVYISEIKSAFLCGMQLEEFTACLFRLESLGIIEYLPKKRFPQILFLLNRASASLLQINTIGYLERKKRFEERLSSMEKYLQQQDACRSVFLAEYFDAPTEKCGICDVCLQFKKTSVITDDFEMIHYTIMNQIPLDGIDIHSLLQMNRFSKEKFWKVFQYLEDQGIINVIDGYVKKLKQGS